MAVGIAHIEETIMKLPGRTEENCDKL